MTTNQHKKKRSQQRSTPTMLNNLDLNLINSGKKKRTNVLLSFPQKLHQMLTDVHNEGMEEIVSWLGSSNAFRIHNPDHFVKYVMPRYFKQSHIRSCQRQFNNYGFKRIIGGPYDGAYQHPQFLQGRPDLAKEIVRIAAIQNKAKSATTKGASFSNSFSSSMVPKSSVSNLVATGSTTLGDVGFTLAQIVIPERPKGLDSWRSGVTDGAAANNNNNNNNTTNGNGITMNGMNANSLHSQSFNTENSMQGLAGVEGYEHGRGNQHVPSYLYGAQNPATTDLMRNATTPMENHSDSATMSSAPVSMYQFTTTTKRLKGGSEDDDDDCDTGTGRRKKQKRSPLDIPPSEEFGDNDFAMAFHPTPLARLQSTISAFGSHAFRFGRSADHEDSSTNHNDSNSNSNAKKSALRSQPKMGVDATMPKLNPQESAASFSGMQFHPPPLTRLISQISSSFGIVVQELKATAKGVSAQSGGGAASTNPARAGLFRSANSAAAAAAAAERKTTTLPVPSMQRAYGKRFVVRQDGKETREAATSDPSTKSNKSANPLQGRKMTAQQTISRMSVTSTTSLIDDDDDDFKINDDSDQEQTGKSLSSMNTTSNDSQAPTETNDTELAPEPPRLFSRFSSLLKGHLPILNRFDTSATFGELGLEPMADGSQPPSSDQPFTTAEI